MTSAQGLGTLADVRCRHGRQRSACAVGTCLRASTPGSAERSATAVSISGWGNSRNNIQSAIRALERDGLVRTLAEPNLTAISGEPAEFLAGGEVPYVTGVDTQTGVSSVAFKKFGVQLSFTPVVLTEGRISLKIDTSVSDIAEFICRQSRCSTRGRRRRWSNFRPVVPSRWRD